MTRDGTEIVVEFTQRFTVTPPDDINDQAYAEQWFWQIYPEIGRDVLDWKNADNYKVLKEQGQAAIVETGTERCINCGDEIQGDGVYTQSGVKSAGHERLADGESVKISNLMEMNDGPYCSLDCSIDTETDRSGGDG